MNAIAPSSAPATGPALDNRRVLAALIDIAVVVLGTVLLTTVLGMLLGGITWGPQLSLVTAAWALYYYFALESGDGQTLGKKVMNLRVVRADGGATGMHEIAVRTVLRVVDGICLYLVGLIVMMITGERRQRLGDLAAGTIVVDASSAPAAAAGVGAVPPVAADAPPTDGSFPVAQSPADVGSPPAGPAAPEQPGVPQVTAFNPFPTPDPTATAPSVEPQPEPATAEPVAEEPTYEPEPSTEPAAPAAPEPVADEPTYEPESVVPEPASEEPAVEPYPYSELPPSEPVPAEPAFGHAPSEEPAAEKPVVEPEPPVAPEPVAEEPTYTPEPAVAPEPVAADPEPVAEEPVVEPEPEPVAAESEPAAEEPVVEPEREPVEPADEPASAERAADRNGVGEEADPQVKVKSVETVSPMDLIMGEDDEDDSRPSQDDGSAA